MIRMLTFRSKENIDRNGLIKSYGLEEYGITVCPPSGLWFISGTTAVNYTDFVPFVLDTTRYEFICITPTFFRWSFIDDRAGELKNINEKDLTFIKAFNHLNSLVK